MVLPQAGDDEAGATASGHYFTSQSRACDTPDATSPFGGITFQNGGGLDSVSADTRMS